MKKVIFSSMLLATILIGCKNQNEETTAVDTQTEEVSQEIAMTKATFGVRGNCGMCKSTIEKAANNVDGVSMAEWDVDRKKIDVAFDADKTNEMAIHEAIAASGYDTEKVSGSEEAYNNLPQCCQYDHNMAMNQEVAEGEEGNHHEEGDHDPMEH